MHLRICLNVNENLVGNILGKQHEKHYKWLKINFQFMMFFKKFCANFFKTSIFDETFLIKKNICNEKFEWVFFNSGIFQPESGYHFEQ